jgi:hypothetical protein
VRGPRPQFAPQTRADAQDALHDGSGIEGGSPPAVDLGHKEVDGQAAPLVVLLCFFFVFHGFAQRVVERA